MAIRILSSENITGNLTLHSSSNAPYIDFVENADTSDSKARITMDQIDTNNGTLLFATENAGTLYNQVKITQTGNLLLSNDAASFNTANAKLNVLPASSGVYQQWNYSPSNENFSLKLKETVTSGNVRYVFEQINNSTTYPNVLVFNSGKVGIGTDEPSEKLDVVGTSGTTNIRVYDSSANSEVGLKLEGDAKTWTLQNWGSGGDNLRVLNNSGNIVQLWDDNGKVAIGNFNDPDRTLDVRGDGMSIYGTGNYTELMLRGQVEGTGTVRNVGAFNLSIRSDVGGDNDDLKFLRFVNGTYSGIAMQIQNTTGNVGIGTDSPQNILHLKSNDPKIYLEDGNAGTNEKVYVVYPAGSQYVLQTQTDAFGAGQQVYVVDRTGTTVDGQKWYINNSAALVLDSVGNVGIGLTSPSTKLQVNGSANTLCAHFGGQNNTDGHWQGISLGYAENANANYRKVGIVAKAVGDGAARQELHFLVDSNADGGSASIADSKMMIDKLGHVAINLTDPNNYYGDQLVIAAPDENGITITGTGSSQKQYICFADGSTGAQAYTGHIAYDHDGDSMVFATNGGAGAMYIDSSQRVGIGTTSPAVGSQLTLRSSASTGMTILSASNTGECFINFSDNDDANVGQIFYGHSPDRMAFRVGDDTRMTILGSNGNVGIGTTNPGAKLTISGGDIYQLGSSGGYTQTKVLPKTTPNFPSAGSSGTPQNWYQPVRGESGIIYYGNVNNTGGEYRCAGFVVFSAAESNNTPVAITIAATESIGAHMLAFSTASGWIQIQNTYGYAIIVMGRVESFVP